jgi:hypothetical protein
MYFGKRIVQTDTHTHVIIRENGHTLTSRIMKYNITTTYNIIWSKNRHMYVPPRFPYRRKSEKRDGGREFRLGRVVWEEVRAKVTVLRGLGEEGVTLLRMGGSGSFGGRPQRGGRAGRVPTGRWAGLRRWTETESVRDPIWRRKE